MVNENLLFGLIRKRAEIAGQLEEVQMRLRQLIVEVDNLDGTIRLFKPDMDLDDIRPKAIPYRHMAFSGEIRRVGLGVLRETGTPLTTRDITLRIMAERSLNVGDPKLVRIVQKRLGSTLRNLRAKGIVTSDHGKGSNLRWSLSS
jgi:hypothetical protein